VETAKRRFEYVAGSSSKFWETWRDGDNVLVTYGKIGTTGQTTIKTFVTSILAQSHTDKMIREKLGKGYKEVTSNGQASSSRGRRNTLFGSNGQVAEALSLFEERTGKKVQPSRSESGSKPTTPPEDPPKRRVVI
jgi:predicted DNA-binding WGR domain protein